MKVVQNKKRRPQKFKSKSLTDEIIPCSFQMRPQWIFKREADPGVEMKCGSYHGSFFNDVSAYGLKRWMIIATINVDFEASSEKELTEREVVEGCVNYLSLPPPRKKYAKKNPKPLYGNLELYKYYVKEKNLADNKTRVQVFIITDEKKNKYFWGEGVSR